jgi:SAM-dependent methyltransferase
MLYFEGPSFDPGVDMIEGPGVDVVADAHDLAAKFPGRQWDVVVSTEMLEHDDRFWLSLEQIRLMLKPGGILLLTARGNGFWPHGYPYDFYRFMPDSFAVLLKLTGCEVLEVTEDWYPGHPGLFGVGRRTRDG